MHLIKRIEAGRGLKPSDRQPSDLKPKRARRAMADLRAGSVDSLHKIIRDVSADLSDDVRDQGRGRVGIDVRRRGLQLVSTTW